MSKQVKGHVPARELHGDDVEPATNLLAAFQGRVRWLDDTPAPSTDDQSVAMLAQLRDVADDLVRPRAQGFAPRLMTPPVAVETEIQGDAGAPTLDLSAVHAAVASLERATAANDAELRDTRAQLATVAEGMAAGRRELIAATTSIRSQIGGFLASLVQRDKDGDTRPSSSKATKSELAQEIQRLIGSIASVRASEESARRAAADAEQMLAEERVVVERTKEMNDQTALQRAIGMLSVLESLDDVVVSLDGRTDESSQRRLAHFEREARAMARLVELEEISTSGTVDPDRHEVVATTRNPAVAGTIIDVRQRGYSFRGRVVRPAQVVVSA